MRLQIRWWLWSTSYESGHSFTEITIIVTSCYRYDVPMWNKRWYTGAHDKKIAYAENKSFKWEVDKINALFVCLALCVCLIFNSFRLLFFPFTCSLFSYDRFEPLYIDTTPPFARHFCYCSNGSSLFITRSPRLYLPCNWAILDVYSDINCVHVWKLNWW